MAFNVSATIGDARPDLAEIYQGYDADGVSWAHEIVMPFATVDKQAATLPAESVASTLRIEDMKRAPGGQYNRIDADIDAITYACKGIGLEFPIHLGDGRLFQLPSLNQEQMAARLLRTKSRLWYEKAMAGVLFSAALKGTAQAMTVAWDTYATSTPFVDITNACLTVESRTGMRPNTLTLSSTNYSNMLNSASVKGWFPGAVIITKDLVTQALAGICGITRIAVSSARENTADQGLDMVTASILPADYVAVSVSAESMDTPYVMPSCGRIFSWSEDSAEPIVFEQYFWEPSRSIINRVRANVDVNLWNTDLVQLIDVD